MDDKETNPKDRIGSTKLPLDLVPSTVKTYAALAFLEGALKYGAYNWRVSGVRISIYKAALERHLDKFWNGEWADPKTNVPHLASVIACAGIILDANVASKVYDDRPPAVALGNHIDEADKIVAHLKEMFKEKNPKHWTVQDAKENNTQSVT